MSFLIDIKRKNARDEVIKKLKIWAYMMKNGVPPATDFIPSCSTSLLIVSNDQPNPKGKEKQIIHAIIKEDEYKEFVERYTAIVYSLDELEKEAIINKYLNEYSSSEMKYGNNEILGNYNIYTYLERAYTNIVFMDETIDYDLNDYFEWKNSYYKKRSKQTEMRERALIYLSKLNTEISSKRIDEKEIECVNLIPELQREALMNYINKKKKLTSYEWRKVKQAICSFMYIHNDFDYDIEDYRQDMEDTNKAWKKCFNHVVREVRIAKERELKKKMNNGKGEAKRDEENER